MSSWATKGPQDIQADIRAAIAAVKKQSYNRRWHPEPLYASQALIDGVQLYYDIKEGVRAARQFAQLGVGMVYNPKEGQWCPFNVEVY